jgi:hypothetical protein
MQKHNQHLCLFAGLMLCVPAIAEQWFTVARPGADAASTWVEIDLDTVRERSQGGERVVRITFDMPQPHSGGFRYRSFVASAQFDCQRRRISLTSAAYYAQPAGKGARLGADSAAKDPGMPPALLDSIPAAARRSLLKATCGTTQTPAA